RRPGPPVSPCAAWIISEFTGLTIGGHPARDVGRRAASSNCHSGSAKSAKAVCGSSLAQHGRVPSLLGGAALCPCRGRRAPRFHLVRREQDGLAIQTQPP